MRILITNIALNNWSGTTVYVRDLALELLRTGHEPTVYTKIPGVAAHDIEKSGVPVVTRLRNIRAVPDVIHAHHAVVTRRVLRHFPGVPALAVCHDHTSVFDRTVIDAGIRKYFGVSNLCVERLRREGVEPGRAQLLSNFVDTRRFAFRDHLPRKPQRALVFSNYASGSAHLPAVAEACCRAGLRLDVIGASAGNAVAQPESVLGRYDIVFAKAKAAMEAMATGAAVVLCDFGGVGPAVTRDNFDRLQPLNFGFEALVGPLTPEAVLQQIDRYDPVDAMHVGAKLRAVASLDDAVRNLCKIYKDVVSTPRSPHRTMLGALPSNPDTRLDAVRTTIELLWLRFPPSGKKLLKRAPGMSTLLPKVRQMLS
jgi:hypothetical protein